MTIKVKENNTPRVSVLETLSEIKQFIWHYKKDADVAGFNTYVSKIPGKSYIIAKHVDGVKPVAALAIWMDIIDPVQRPIIFNAINEALYGESMTPEAMENEMISKADED